MNVQIFFKSRYYTSSLITNPSSMSSCHIYILPSLILCKRQMHFIFLNSSNSHFSKPPFSHLPPYPYLLISACLREIAAVLQILHRPSPANTLPLTSLFKGCLPQRLRKIDFHSLSEIVVVVLQILR